MRYGLVVWDFDGTLADSLGGLLRAYNRLAERHGFRPVADVAAARGLTLRAFLRAHDIPLWRLPALVRRVLAEQRREAAGIRLFAGIPEALRGLRQAGVRLAVLSSNAAENIGACLRAGGVEELFEQVVGYRRLFGKGRALRRFLKGRGSPAGEILYVGDEVRDIEAAREAGVSAAAVTWGYHTAELLTDHAPDHMLDAPGQVLPVALGVRR